MTTNIYIFPLHRCCSDDYSSFVPQLALIAPQHAPSPKRQTCSQQLADDGQAAGLLAGDHQWGAALLIFCIDVPLELQDCSDRSVYRLQRNAPSSRERVEGKGESYKGVKKVLHAQHL